MPTKAELEVELSLVKNQLIIANAKYYKAWGDNDVISQLFEEWIEWINKQAE